MVDGVAEREGVFVADGVEDSVGQLLGRAHAEGTLVAVAAALSRGVDVASLEREGDADTLGDGLTRAEKLALPDEDDSELAPDDALLERVPPTEIVSAALVDAACVSRALPDCGALARGDGLPLVAPVDVTLVKAVADKTTDEVALLLADALSVEAALAVPAGDAVLLLLPLLLAAAARVCPALVD